MRLSSTGSRVAAATFLVAACAASGYVLGRSVAPDAALADSRSAAECVRVDPKPETPWATKDFPVNEWGMTYGSDSEASSPSEMPDLIAVVSDDGLGGFLLKADLLAFEPSKFSSPGTGSRVAGFSLVGRPA